MWERDGRLAPPLPCNDRIASTFGARLVTVKKPLRRSAFVRASPARACGIRGKVHQLERQLACTGDVLFEVRSGPAFDFQSPEYRDLYARANATAFQHPLWLDRVYRRLVPSANVEPVIATVRTLDDSRLVAVLPLVRARKYGLRVLTFSGLKVSDYLGPVCDMTIEGGVKDAPVARQLRKVLPSFDLLHLTKLRADPHCMKRLLGEVRMSPMPFSSHAVELYGPVSAWRKDKIDRSTLRELDQNTRWLSRKGEVRLEMLTVPERIHEVLSAMREYRKPRFQNREGEDLLQDPAYYQFYADLASNGAGVFTRTYALTVDHRPVGGCFGLAFRGEFLILLMGFDRDHYKNRSVGSILVDAILQDCIERGDEVCDFTIGDEAYKMKFGTKPRVLLEGWMPGSLAGSTAIQAKNQLPWAIALAKRVVGKRPG